MKDDETNRFDRPSNENTKIWMDLETNHNVIIH